MTSWIRSPRNVRAWAPWVSLALSLPAWSAGSESEQRARELFAEAKKAYGLADFEGALKRYAEAYELDPLPGFLFDLGQCNRQLGRYERAIFFYREFLSQSPRPPPNAAEVQEFIADLERKKKAQESDAREAAQARQERALADARAESARKEAEDAKRRLEAALASPAPEPPPGPLYKRWWVWAGGGAVVAGVAAGATWLAVLPHPRPTTLPDINAR